MALRELLTALEEEGAAEYEQAQRDRRRQADQMIAAARERGARAHEDAVMAAEAIARQDADRLLTAARWDARRAVRTARDDASEKVFEQAREELLALPGSPAGAAAARACAEEALAAMPHATTLRVHPADAPALRPGVAMKLVTDLETGGAIAEDDHGRYIDNTYVTRLANTWPELRAKLSQSWDQDS